MMRTRMLVNSSLFFLIIIHTPYMQGMNANIKLEINGTINGKLSTTEQPLAVNLSVPIPYVVTTSGIVSGASLMTVGLSGTMKALTMPPTCTKSCRHSTASLTDDSLSHCPKKQGSCWRLRTPECHNATSHIVMGSVVITTSLLYAYCMNMFGS